MGRWRRECDEEPRREATTGIDRQSIFRELDERVVIETVGRTEHVDVMIRKAISVVFLPPAG